MTSSGGGSSSSSSHLFSLVRTPLAASGIEESISARFLDISEDQLITIGANVLKVFRIRPQNLTDTGQYDDLNPPKMRLECLATWTLSSPIQSIGKVRFLNARRDSLVLSFLDAKISVIDYDPENHDLKTVSLHIFEDEEVRSGYVSNQSIPFIRVDPESRCAAMLIYGRKIVILPFKRDLLASTEDELIGGGGESSKSSSAAPVLSSYALDLSTVLPAHTVENVIDIQFLHGYNQPTLMILYEPLKTCPGRIAVRKDTCRLDVVTLDVKERVCAFIWSKENLPFDCLKALPVPKPIGGTLVFSVNAVHYLNQGIPAFGLSLNSIGDATLENIARQELVSLTLDCAQAVFITPERAVISLRGGEIYVMSLILDGGIRSVRGFHFDRAAASVLTTCLTVLEDRFLFLGSRLGNSLLLQFREKELNSIPEAVIETIEPPLKKKRTDGNEDWMASDVGDIKDVDLEVYGREDKVATSRVSSYSFEVCDSLLNIGPCGHVSMGDPAFLSEEFNSAKMADPDVELVTTSGHGKNGALCVLQQTIRPQVVTTFELPGCLNMWTVHGDTDLANGHAFLILSRADSTMVLQTGQEINELDNSGFFTQGPTIFTGNMGNNKYIVQVCPNGVRLLKGSKQVQHLPLELSGPIIKASCADPYLVIMSTEGQLVLLTLETKVGSPKLSVLKANLKSRSKLLNICAYKDVSGLFTTEAPETVDESGATVQVSSTSIPSAPPIPDIEDEDALLYGDAAPSNLFSGDFKASQSGNTDAQSAGSSAPFWRKHMKPHKASFWVFLYRENGHLEILTLPDFSVKYVVRQFYLGQDVLVDGTLESEDNFSSSLRVDALPAITEILMVGLGAQGSRPVLLARSQDHELLCYEVFPYYEKTDKDQLKIRFKKTKHGLILRERRGKTRKEAMAAPKSSMRVFHDIAGYEGVFLCGPYPHWLMLTSRGELRTHPMPIDGPVPCFAAFHNVNCPQGFLYFNKKGELRICVLPTHLSYDAPWPVRKVPLRLTPHFITYHLESKTYAVVTSSSEPTKQVWKFNGDDKELVDETRDDRYPWPNKDLFTLQLFSPVSWEPIPNTKEQMNDWERCTSLKHLCLSSEGLHSGQRGYIVCGTSYSYGEDVTPRGYIRIYDVIEVIPEPGQPLTKNKIKTVYDKEQKGPVTSITAVNGYLVATVGQKIYIFQFKNKDLFGVAFIDSRIYIHQLVSLKNFILVGDVMKSVDLLQFQQDYRTLAVISRDAHPLEVYSCEYIVDNNVLAFLVTDADKNMVIFMYQPDNRESRGGQQLVRKADFHLGQHVNTIFRIRAKITDPTTSGRVITGWEKRQVTWFATLDGALGYLLPCAEKTFRRLQMLLNVLNHGIPHPAGLNPKASRLIRQQRKDLLNPAKSVVDGDLVFRFTDMSHPMKQDFAKKIGTSAVDLMDDLAELDRMAAHF